MDNIISLIERLGANSELRFSTRLTLANQTPELFEINKAISSGNVDQLEFLLNTRNKVVCMIFPVEEPKEQPEQPDEDDSPDNTGTRIAV